MSILEHKRTHISLWCPHAHQLLAFPFTESRVRLDEGEAPFLYCEKKVVRSLK